jgi:GTP cyclohydrolase I
MSSQPDADMTHFPPDEGTPVSVKIRERITAARKRFNANDNIAEFIQPGELEKLLDEVEVKMQGVLDSLVIDTEGDHNTDRPPRAAWPRCTSTRCSAAVRQGADDHRVPQCRTPQRADDRRADHGAQCLQPPFLPGHRQDLDRRHAQRAHQCDRPVQVRKAGEWVMGRPQIQEEAVVQLADLIQVKTQPDGLAIVMEASHYCMAWRGVKDMDSKMINSVMRGSFLKDPNLRREFLSLIPGKG